VGWKEKSQAICFKFEAYCICQACTFRWLNYHLRHTVGIVSEMFQHITRPVLIFVFPNYYNCNSPIN
jgi:hypothetical protein